MMYDDAARDFLIGLLVEKVMSLFLDIFHSSHFACSF
jgi:hypothetical protein